MTPKSGRISCQFRIVPAKNSERIVASELASLNIPEPAIAAMLMALRFKGETAEEMIGAARALRGEETIPAGVRPGIDPAEAARLVPALVPRPPR